MIKWRWLIVKASGEMRVIQRQPSLNWDEVAFRLKLTIPKSWGTVAGNIDLTIPEGTVVVEPMGFEQPEPSGGGAGE